MPSESSPAGWWDYNAANVSKIPLPLRLHCFLADCSEGWNREVGDGRAALLPNKAELRPADGGPPHWRWGEACAEPPRGSVPTVSGSPPASCLGLGTELFPPMPTNPGGEKSGGDKQLEKESPER